jgi:hypothetical protein
MVGRSHRTVALEPLLLDGVNLASGISGFRLRVAR